MSSRYIFSVLITSVITSNRIYSLASSAASVIVFNLLFTEPRFTLLAHGKGYPVTFIVMFLAAFISGTLVNRLKAKRGAVGADGIQNEDTLRYQPAVQRRPGQRWGCRRRGSS